MNFQDFRTYFDDHFSTFLAEKVATFSKESTSASVANIAQYAMRISAQGKRFRPFLVATALGTDEIDAHHQLLYAVELLHIFALIHDDIMDEGVLRHGVPCVHRAYGDTFQSPRIGQGVAILLGDLFYQWSYECITSYAHTHPAKGQEIIELFSALVREVIHGQLLDLISPAEPPLSKELITQKMYLKTVRYSFIQPLRLGFAAAGTRQDNDTFAESYGKSLGLLFQLQDDLLDVTEGHDKSTFLDIETSQQTLLSWYMHEKALPAERDAFTQYLGRSLSADDKQAVAKLVTESGARAYVTDQIEAHYKETISAIDGREEIWRDIAALVYGRSK